MRSTIRSNSQLSELRASVRRDLTVLGDDDQIIDDFVAAVNEVVAAVLSNRDSVGGSVDVRWHRRTDPRAELYAEIRNMAQTPTSLLSEGIVCSILHQSAEHVDVHERIGGSLISIRSRI